MSQSLPIAPSRKLKITILTVGSRGDLQPYCALAIGLKRAGHEVTLATHENFEPFVRKFDLKFALIAGNMEEFLQSKQGQRLIAGEKLKKEEADKLLLQQLESAWSALLNHFRTETLKLPPLPYFGRRFRQKTPANVSRIPVLYGFSSHVIPRPRDWPAWVYVTGFWFIDQASEYEPPLELEDFLGRKQLPLCFGFGSMTMPNPEYLTHYIVEALKKTHQGGIILSGWGDVGRTVNIKDSLRVFVIKEVPHDWLFPQVPAVVHHGGASTTAAVLRAGTPSVTVPFFADQPVWGEKLTRLGVSPAPIPYKKVSDKTLAAAIEVVLGDEVMRCKAQELGQKIRDEDGVANAVEVFHRHLGLIG